MDHLDRPAISNYKTIAVLNEAHKVYLVQHRESCQIYVEKVLDVYNSQVYQYLYENHFSGIPKIEELYEDTNQLIVVEEYIAGQSLQDIIDHSVLNIELIFHYMIELCKILEHTHAVNPPIIHRDIKPSNIIVTSFNNVVLLDFNAAKYYSDGSSSDTVLLGTKGYAAPEQYGFGSSAPQTDIYALGILLKEMTASLINSTSIFDPVIAKCTQMNPSDRYSSIAELKSALQQLAHPTVQAVEEPFSLKSLIFPGYRTKTPWHMIVATPIYAFIFWLSLSLEIKGASISKLWLERICFLLMMLSIVFGSFNYLGMQKYFPLCMCKNRILHYLGIILLDFLLVMAFMMLLIITESLLY